MIDGLLSPSDFSFGNVILWVFFFGLAGFVVSLTSRIAAKPTTRSDAKLEIVAQLSRGGVWDEELDG